MHLHWPRRELSAPATPNRSRSVYLPATQQVGLQANAGSILFDPLHGTSTPTATARVIGTMGAIHHVVNVMGRVRSCSPEPAIPGYRTC